MIRPRAGRRANGESKLGSPAWRASFERRLAARAHLARLTRWRSIDTGPPRFIDGNHGFYVHDGRRQPAWTLAAIDQARERIDFEVYIYEPDAVGTEVRDHLAQAARRGVAVRLLVDAVGGANPGPGSSGRCSMPADTSSSSIRSSRGTCA